MADLEAAKTKLSAYLQSKDKDLNKEQSDIISAAALKFATEAGRVLTHKFAKKGFDWAKEKVTAPTTQVPVGEKVSKSDGEKEVKQKVRINTQEHKFNQWNLGEAVVTKKHHNWYKIFGDQKVSLADVEPYIKKAIEKGKWKVTNVIRGTDGKIIGEKLELIYQIDLHKIWVGAFKDLEGNIIVNNAAVQ